MDYGFGITTERWMTVYIPLKGKVFSERDLDRIKTLPEGRHQIGAYRPNYLPNGKQSGVVRNKAMHLYEIRYEGDKKICEHFVRDESDGTIQWNLVETLEFEMLPSDYLDIQEKQAKEAKRQARIGKP